MTVMLACATVSNAQCSNTSAGNGWTCVQQVDDFSFGAGPSLPLTFGSNTVSGHLLTCFVSSTSGFTATISGGGTWHQIGSTLPAGYGQISAWYALASGGSTTVTMGGGSGSTFPSGQCAEYSVVSGTPTLDPGSPCSATSGGGNLSPAECTITPGFTNELFTGFAIPANGSTFQVTTGNKVDAGATYSGSYDTQAGTGAYTITFKTVSGSMGMIGASFYGASAPANCSPTLTLISIGRCG